MSSYACRYIGTSEKDSKVMASATYLKAACHKVSTHVSNLKSKYNRYTLVPKSLNYLNPKMPEMAMVMGMVTGTARAMGTAKLMATGMKKVGGSAEARAAWRQCGGSGSLAAAAPVQWRRWQPQTNAQMQIQNLLTHRSLMHDSKNCKKRHPHMGSPRSLKLGALD
jgi:hypothetical protein